VAEIVKEKGRFSPTTPCPMVWPTPTLHLASAGREPENDYILQHHTIGVNTEHSCQATLYLRIGNHSIRMHSSSPDRILLGRVDCTVTSIEVQTSPVTRGSPFVIFAWLSFDVQKCHLGTSVRTLMLATVNRFFFLFQSRSYQWLSLRLRRLGKTIVSRIRMSPEIPVGACPTS
jgi:hypothetical protein